MGFTNAGYVLLVTTKYYGKEVGAGTQAGRHMRVWYRPGTQVPGCELY